MKPTEKAKSLAVGAEENQLTTFETRLIHFAHSSYELRTAMKQEKNEYLKDVLLDQLTHKEKEIEYQLLQDLLERYIVSKGFKQTLLSPIELLGLVLKDKETAKDSRYDSERILRNMTKLIAEKSGGNQ